MKTLWALMACLLTLPVAGRAEGGITAKTALNLVQKPAGDQMSSKIVYVSGQRGQDQPMVWLFTIRNSQGFFVEYNMTGRRFVGSRNVPTFRVGQPINLRRWKIDSNTAFVTAEKAARAARIGFDSTSYELRCAEFSDQPVWFLTLLTVQGQKVGTITISAENGAVLQKQFFEVAPPRPGQTQYYPPAYAGQQNRNGLWDKTKSTFQQGAQQTRSTVRGWMDRLSGKPQPQPYLYGPQGR
jgi:hypothetical protein